MVSNWEWFAVLVAIGSAIGAVALSVISNLITPRVAASLTSGQNALRKRLKTAYERDLLTADRVASDPLFRSTYIGKAIILMIRRAFLTTLMFMAIGMWVAARDSTTIDIFWGNVVAFALVTIASLTGLPVINIGFTTANVLDYSTNLEAEWADFHALYDDHEPGDK